LFTFGLWTGYRVWRHLRQKPLTQVSGRALEGVTGACLIGLGARLAWDRR
jgi:hypothetical protein